MNQVNFLKDPSVCDFIEWITMQGPYLPIHLKVQKSRFVPVTINKTFTGIQNTVSHYSWKSMGMTKGDWKECSEFLTGLSRSLKEALAAGSNADTLKACKDILAWGGNRSWKRGAWPFLNSKPDLVGYLTSCKSVLALSSANHFQLHGKVGHMNSMLTKVHALASDDGLPIYDSRVAAAIAVLVELWRRDRGLWKNPLPKNLIFPSVYGARSVLDAFPDAINPGILTGKASEAASWATAKVRLGWIMEQVLKENTSWFGDIPQFQNRMHALEASLFMLGYDVTCMHKENSVASLGLKNSLTKKILPLSGNGTEIHYQELPTGGFDVCWGSAHFKINNGLINSILTEFAGQKNVALGASRTNPTPASLGEWLHAESYTLSGMSSPIAAILVNEGIATMDESKRGKAIYLSFE